MTPLISVIMGTLYLQDDLSLLERSVNSILSQSFSDFELIICSHGSTDAAHTFLKRCAEKDTRIRLIAGNNKKHLPGKLNACLAEAKGKYIARMDDDDFSQPDRLKEQLDFLNSHPEVAFVGCNVNLTRNGEPVGQRILPEYPIVRDFYMTQPYIHPALIFRHEALDVVKGYSEDKNCILCEDYDLLLRLYANGFQGSNLQKFLFDYTVSEKAKGNRKMKHRWNESVTRWRRFRKLGVLPYALPYVVKPIVVGLIPECMLAKLKNSRRGGDVL